MSVRLVENKGLPTVKLYQLLLTCTVTAGIGTLHCTGPTHKMGAELRLLQVEHIQSSGVDCHYRPPAAALSWPDVCHRQMTRKRLRGWRALRRRRKNSRRKEGLSETTGFDRAFIQQHLLCVSHLSVLRLNSLIDSRDTRKKTSLFFMI